MPVPGGSGVWPIHRGPNHNDDYSVVKLPAPEVKVPYPEACKFVAESAARSTQSALSWTEAGCVAECIPGSASDSVPFLNRQAGIFDGVAE